MAAHPVGDHVETEGVIHEKRIFIAGALAPEIREGEAQPLER
jgi:hypothetical protein